MERPERPRRHKTIIQRQTPRPTVRPRPSPSGLYEVAYESDSDTTDMEVDVSHQPQTQLHRSMGNFEERPINRLRSPVLTTAPQHLLNRSSSDPQGLNNRSESFRSRRDSRYPNPLTLLIGRSALNVTPDRPVAETGSGLFSRTQNKRFRNHIVGPFTSRPGQSGVPIADFTPHTTIPQLPPGPITLSPPTATQGGPIPIVNLFKPDVNPPLNNGSTSETGSMESPFTRSLQAAVVSSNPTRSRILDEIDELCYPFPSRPRLTPRRRLHNLRSRDTTLSCVSCSRNNDSTNTNNNPFVVRESPLSPPLLDTGINVNEQETGRTNPYTSSFEMYTARGDDHIQMSDNAGETQTVMCQIMMNSTDAELRPADNNMQQDGHSSSLPTFTQMGRILTAGIVQQLDISPSARTLSPILCEPHTPNTSPPISPISPVYNNPSPFDIVSPTSPLTSPPNSPVANNAHVFNETANSSASVLEFYDSSTEDEASNEERNLINDIIVLDTPERPIPIDRQTTPLRSSLRECPTTTELPNHPRDVTVVTFPLADRSDQALPSTTSAPSVALVPIRARKSKTEVVNASDTLKELNQNLVSLLECPVCLDFMVPPILQCNKGHLVCAACRPKLTVCPTCRSRFAERNLAMEKVAEKLMYPCKNVVTGCNFTLKLKDKAKHEQNCGFRHFDCIVRSCEWKGYKPELIVHLSSVHEDKIFIGNEKDISVSYTAERESWIFYTFDEVFLLTVVADHISKKLLSCVQIIGSPEKAPEFVYTLKLERNDPYMSMQFWHQTHTDEFKAVSIFYANKGIIMDVNDVKRYAVRGNHRRVSVSVTIKRTYE